MPYSTACVAKLSVAIVNVSTDRSNPLLYGFNIGASMSTMNGGTALIKSLENEGVQYVFGLPGAGQYEATDGIYESNKIQYISTRHEQATSYMADGYARVSGQPGVALVVPGPGFYNAMAGLSTAYAISSPVLVVTGSPHYNHGAEHAAPALDLLAPVCKWAGRAAGPADIPGVIQEAFYHLRSGHPRPVVVEIPTETLAGKSPVSLMPSREVERVTPDREGLAAASAVLAGAKKPLIWVGNGASDAASGIRELAEYLQAPVVSSRRGKGILSHRHPLCLGMAEPRVRPLADWISSSDVILAVGVGARFDSYRGTCKVVRIDNEASTVDRQNDHALGVLSEADDAVSAILDQVRERGVVGRDGVVEAVKKINDHRYGPEEQLEPQASYMNAIRAALPDDGMIVAGMNQMGYYSRNYFEGYQPGTYHTSSNHGTLGCVYPIAIGAKVAAPDRAVVSISGDGGFLYNVQEIATAVKYNIGVIAIVFNDNAYGNVLRAQIEEYDNHVIGTQLSNPDFSELGKVFGARGVKAEDADQLEDAVRDGIKSGNPTLIEVPVGMMDRRY